MESTTRTTVPQAPTPAFIGAAWLALLIGMSAYLIGLFNAGMELNEKGYYFAILILGLFSAVSLQKTVRDRSERIPVTAIYYGIAWFAVVLSLALLAIGLWNAGSMTLSEKGFYGIAFAMSLFAAVAVQKNVRDLAQFKRATAGESDDPEAIDPSRLAGEAWPPAAQPTQPGL